MLTTEVDMEDMEVVRAMVDTEVNMTTADMVVVRVMVVDMAGKEVDMEVEGMAMIRDMHLLNKSLDTQLYENVFFKD
jgi:hypothetical protein